MAVVDVDLKHAFLSFEWDSIRKAVAKRAPKLLAWIEWCHMESARVHLPSGASMRVDRGAKQGDPLGSVYCALIIADVVEIVRERLSANGINIFDLWYMDDGQIFCEAVHVDAVLRTFDDVVAEVGGMRGTGDEAKSVVRMLGKADAIEAANDMWCTEYVAASTKPIPAHGGHVLGINIENFDELSSQFNAVTDEVEALHTNLAQVEDAATEIVLVRVCADVCKVTHLLRAGGIGIATESLDK